jgi:hypothetical protein
MESLKLAVFITQVLHCFNETKKRICTELIQLSNQDNSDCTIPTLIDASDSDKIAYFYTQLLLETIAESQFLEFANHHPDKITDRNLKDHREFYAQFTHWRVR